MSESNREGPVQAVPCASDADIAAELSAILTVHLMDSAPLELIRELTELLRILRLVSKDITERRAHEAYAVNAIWPQRKVAKLAGVTPSTMQRWCESGTASAANGRLWSAPQPGQDLGSDTRTAGQDGVNGPVTHS